MRTDAERWELVLAIDTPIRDLVAHFWLKAGWGWHQYEDAVQHALLAAFDAAATFDVARGASWRTYAGQAAWWAVRQFLRAECRRPTPQYFGDDGEFGPLTEDPEPAEGPDPADVAASALSCLGPDQRADVEGYYGLGLDRGLTLREIGERHGVTRQAVHCRLRNALARMRAHLGVSA